MLQKQVVSFDFHSAEVRDLKFVNDELLFVLLRTKGSALPIHRVPRLLSSLLTE